MAFSYTVNSDQLHGKLRIVTGGYNAASVTGGDINTGLTTIYHVQLQPKDSSVSAAQPVVNETLPKATDGITIVTASGEVGTWMAIGI